MADELTPNHHAHRMHTAARCAMLAMLLLTLVGCTPDAPPKSIHVTLAGQAFDLELAITEAQVEHGLMGRKSLGDHAGMLFVFDKPQVLYFWMKNCLIPLDVIFTDAQGRIVSIRHMTVPTDNANPPNYSSRWPAQFAIELAAGRVQQLGLQEGDHLDLPVDRLKRLAE